MSTSETPAAPARRGAETRRRAQRVALDLFTRQGYEATSLREIADAVGVNKASLYYYFPSKEAILASLLDDRGTEAEELIAWVRAQPPTPQLLEDAVQRWVGSSTGEKLSGIRFMTANPLVVGPLAARGGDRIGSSLRAVVDELTRLVPDATEHDALLIRMALLSINSAVQASIPGVDTDDAVIAAAHRGARALVAEIGRSR